MVSYFHAQLLWLLLVANFRSPPSAALAHFVTTLLLSRQDQLLKGLLIDFKTEAILPNAHASVKHHVAAECCVEDRAMRTNPRTRTNRNIVTNEAVGPDRAVASDLRTCRDDSCRVDTRPTFIPRGRAGAIRTSSTHSNRIRHRRTATAPRSGPSAGARKSFRVDCARLPRVAALLPPASTLPAPGTRTGCCPAPRWGRLIPPSV